MPFDAPFMLGPFSVNAEGRISPRDPNCMPAFLFRWRGRMIRARLGTSRPDRGRLSLRCLLGRIPSTGDSLDQGPRTQSFSALHGLRGRLPPHWRLDLLPDHGVLLDSATEIPLPITATGLLTELTVFLLALAPYLDVLEERGVSPSDASPADGMVKTCPG